MGRLHDATPPPGALCQVLAKLAVERHAHVRDRQARRMDEDALKLSLWAEDEKHGFKLKVKLQLERLD